MLKSREFTVVSEAIKEIKEAEEAVRGYLDEEIIKKEQSNM